MCGYCTEGIALDLLSSDVRGNLQMKDLGNNLSRYFYLRETPDFIIGLGSLRRSLAHKRLLFFEEVPHSVVLYRGLEILLEHGFSSPAYQGLLKHSLYRDAITAICSNEQRKSFETATVGLKIEHLGLLYDAETYLWGERSKQLRTLANVLPSCRNLLKHYISWWLDGLELQKDDYCVTDKEDSGFSFLFRAFYFSILVVGSCSAGKKILQAIIQRNPSGTPGPGGEDLWLQRLAALKLFNLEGFDAFCKHLTSIRATHYYFLDSVNGFSFEQKRMLLDEVRRHPITETSDDFISLSRWLSKELGEEK